jgi:hypothetical protein
MSIYIYNNRLTQLSGRNKEQIEARESLLVSFGAESFGFQFYIQKYKD